MPPAPNHASGQLFPDSSLPPSNHTSHPLSPDSSCPAPNHASGRIPRLKSPIPQSYPRPVSFDSNLPAPNHTSDSLSPDSCLPSPNQTQDPLSLDSRPPHPPTKSRPLFVLPTIQTSQPLFRFLTHLKRNSLHVHNFLPQFFVYVEGLPPTWAGHPNISTRHLRA